MKNNHTHYEIEVLILEDSQGELWERLKTDDSTYRWDGPTANLKANKTFTTKDEAIKHAEKLGLEKFKVISMTSPEVWGKGLSWKGQIVYKSA